MIERALHFDTFFGEKTAVEIYAKPTSIELENAKADIEINRARYQRITLTRDI